MLEGSPITHIRSLSILMELLYGAKGLPPKNVPQHKRLSVTNLRRDVMTTACSLKNRDPNFGWDEHYGKGFDKIESQRFVEST